MLTRVHEPDAAVRWGEALNAWHGRWKRMLAERTYAKTTRTTPGQLRAGADGGEPICRCAAPISDSNASSKTALFCFLDPELTIPGPVPRDSNWLEGGPNAALQTHARQPPRASRA